jgi:hypothetical protein
MKPRKAETFEPVTMGHLRGHRVTRLLVYCCAINCNHHIVMNADHLTDDTAIRPLGDRMPCSRCGHRGADVRPDWARHSDDHGPGAAHRR